MLAKGLVWLVGSPWKVKAQCHKRTLTGRLARAIWSLFQYENSGSIAWNSNFAGEPCFPHGMKGVFVSGDARVGRNCVIFQQVTIGSVRLPGSKSWGAPSIGDSVYIGAGAKIIGGVHIGDNVRIGANAVVHADVPSNSVVVVGEQRVIQKGAELDNRFYSFHGYWVYFCDGEFLRVEEKEILSALQSDGGSGGTRS